MTIEEVQNSSNLQHTPSILAKKKNSLHVGICICILQVWHKELISKATPLFVFVFMWSLIIQTSSFYLRKYQLQWFSADRAYAETFWWAIFLFKLSGSHVHQADFLVVWRKNTLADPYQPRQPDPLWKMTGSPGQTRPLLWINKSSSWEKICRLIFFQIPVGIWWHWVSRGHYLLVLGGTG